MTHPRRLADVLKERSMKVVCYVCALISIVTTFGIVAVLATEAFSFFQKVSIVEFFTSTKWSPIIKPNSYGVLPLFCGTFLITLGAAIIAVPLGLMAAIYLSELAHPRVRIIIKPLLELLAGIPTVVYGFFAVFYVTPVLQKIIPSVQVFNAASGAIVVGIMVLPLVSSLCEDAIAAVPKSLREGGYALGATKLEVTAKITLPAALSGISAAVILAVSRVVGETMAVTLAAGATPKLTLNPAESIQTMTAYIVQISKGDTPNGTIEYQTIFAVGATLFCTTLAMNVLANKLVRRYRQVYH